MSRYKLGDISNEEFYMLPKSLFKNPRFSDIGVPIARPAGNAR